MKICKPHWNKLRAAISARGMDHLILKSGNEVVKSIETEIAGGKPKLDPLFACNMMIWNKALELGGLAMAPATDGGEQCPVCVAITHGATESHWIDGPADAVLASAKELGLVPNG